MLAELENISYYVQAPGHNKRFPGHNSGGFRFDYNLKKEKDVGFYRKFILFFFLIFLSINT